MRCPNCLGIVDENARKCPACGYRLNKEPDAVYHLPQNTVLHGRYVLGRVLGFGGFGVVYKAMDETLNRIVAVKEYFPTVYLYRDMGSREAQVFDTRNLDAFGRGKEEFLEEARRIAKYNAHPNIVHIYDFFEENGTAYFVMEYLEGHTLKEYINLANTNGKVFTVRSAVHITLEVLKALTATHADGIIHRDVKPNNIFIMENGAVKLFDFGAARFSDAEKEVTRTVILSRGYAPAEQYQSRSKQGPYTDIYAVGAVFYEMLTGEKPEESINRVQNDTLKPPSAINARVTNKLDNVVMRALAVRTEIRFKSTQEFYKALEKGKNIRNAEKEIDRRKHKRNRIILAMFLVLAVLGGYVGYRIYRDYRQVVLDDAKLDIWVSALDGDSAHTEEIYRKMSEEFLEKNPQISVNYTVIPEESYAAELSEALEKGEGPDLYIDPGTDSVKSSEPADIGLVYEDVNFDPEDYYLIGEYKQYFCEQGFFPLMVDVDVMYRNTVKEDLPTGHDYESFIEGKANYIGSILENAKIQNEMAGMYRIVPNPEEALSGRYLFPFCINGSSDADEKRAAARLLHYYLSDNAQEYLSIDEEKGIPVNKHVWDVFMQVNYDFSFLSDAVEEMEFR